MDGWMAEKKKEINVVSLKIIKIEQKNAFRVFRLLMVFVCAKLTIDKKKRLKT